MGSKKNRQAAMAPAAATPDAPPPAAGFQPMPELTSEDHSKDDFFVRLALVADTGLKAHGKDFTMGALLLCARFIAEGRPLIRPRSDEGGDGTG